MHPWEREALERLRNETRPDMFVPLYDYVDDDPPPGYKPVRPAWWDAGKDKGPRGVFEWEV